MTAEIGYGNAAGFLFQKGITAPPPGKIDSLPDALPPSLPQTDGAHGAGQARHPISSLSEPLPQSSDIPMTPEEKEREAERLFVLFERLEKNPLISLTPDGPEGEKGRGEKGLRELMRDKLESGAGEEWDRVDEVEERRRAEEEDRRDEEEVRREMERYRKRKDKGP